MKTKITFSVFLFITITGFSQPNIEWENSFGGSTLDFGRTAITTTDGNYMIAGTTASSDGDVTNNNGSADVWLVKLTSTGNLIWQKTLGGSDSDSANAIVQTTDGGYIVVGDSRSTDGDLTENQGDFDWWIVKVDNLGALQWQKSLGGSGRDTAFDVKQTSDGGYIVAGVNNSNDGDVIGNQGGKDAWIVKFNTSGTVLWSKSLGGTATDEANAIQQTTDGGYIIAGNSSSNNGDVSSNNGSSDFWVVKTDVSGTIQWQKSLGGSGFDQAFSVIQTNDGGYVATGFSSSNNGDVSGNNGQGDIWTVKLDNTGTIEWQKSVGGSLSESANDVQQTNDDGFIIAGKTDSNDGDVTNNQGGSDVWIVKLSDLGILQWQKSLGGSGQDFGNSIRQTSDDGFILGGNSDSSNGDISNNNGGSDFLIVKLSSNLSVEDFNTANILIYPNPSNGIVTIKTKNVSKISISVTDILGRLVFQDENINPQTYSLNLSHSKGVNFIKITTATSEEVFKVIIK